MSCKLTLGIADGGEGARDGSKVIDVQEDFDTVLNQVFPLSPPSSSLEQRSSMIFTDEEGKRIFLELKLIAVVEEL